MHLRPFLALPCLITTATFAADLPVLPAGSIARKKELLFSDDFQGAEPAKVWHKVVPTFAVENGALKGTQTRDQNIPAADGKAAVTAPSPRSNSASAEKMGSSTTSKSGMPNPPGNQKPSNSKR